MKKLLLLIGLIAIGTLANANTLLNVNFSSSDELMLINDVNTSNFWKKKGLSQEKVLSVAHKIMLDNKINKRVPIFVPNKKDVNAYTSLYDKSVAVHEGILYYVDNDDELAFIVAHEIAHSVEANGGVFKYIAMSFNSKKYEQKADLMAVDYMVRAGYNPVAAISMGNKLFGEPIFDWGFTYSHPKGSKRLISMYKHIYAKYPQYLSSSYTKAPMYVNFQYALDKDIRAFEQKQKKRQLRDKQDEL